MHWAKQIVELLTSVKMVRLLEKALENQKVLHFFEIHFALRFINWQWCSEAAVFLKRLFFGRAFPLYYVTVTVDRLERG